MYRLNLNTTNIIGKFKAGASKPVGNALMRSENKYATNIHSVFMRSENKYTANKKRITGEHVKAERINPFPTNEKYYRSEK